MIFIFSTMTQPEMEKFSNFCRFLRFFYTFSYSRLCHWLKNENHEKFHKTFVWWSTVIRQLTTEERGRRPGEGFYLTSDVSNGENDREQDGV